jgi:hypothetical protein
VPVRQLNDEILLAHCRRIQVRAIRRAGEILDEIEPSKGGRPSETHTAAGTSLTRTDLEPQEGTLPRLTRTEAASEAGLSEHQRKQASTARFMRKYRGSLWSALRGGKSARSRVGMTALSGTKSGTSMSRPNVPVQAGHLAGHTGTRFLETRRNAGLFMSRSFCPGRPT